WYDKDNELHDEYDGVAVDALVNAGIVYDYYSDMHGRKSFDDNDARIRSTVHYKKDYVNAFWNGYQMVYGDGDGQEYLPFAAALDVVGHELTHAVTEKTANLEYEGESGAINE
ncbi:Peptidase M4 like protein, partial [Aduncisulcus paluster]